MTGSSHFPNSTGSESDPPRRLDAALPGNRSDRDESSEAGSTTGTSAFTNAADPSGVSWAAPIELTSAIADGHLTEALGSGDHIKDVEANESSLLPEVLGGYKIGRKIGSGGMGEVFLAEHLSMGRSVALKVLPTRWMNRSESIERFYEEVRAASRLLHPNIVTAFDAGQADGIHFLVMEYVDGQTLTQVVANEGPLPIGDAASAIRQTAFALHHAHAAGIVHRDVKPGNLMRAVDGTIKLLDLGLARMAAAYKPSVSARIPPEPMNMPSQHDASHSDRTGSKRSGSTRSSSDEEPKRRAFVGTLSYIAPEQLEDSDSADARSDQYSLGATLFFLLTGKPPYVGELIEQVYGHRHGEIPDLMSFRQDIDLTLANVVRRMLAKDPEARYGSMDEVARAMAPYDNDRSTPAWVLDFARREINEEGSTVAGDSTRRASLQVMGIDLGMTHAATSLSKEDGSFESGLSGRSEVGPKRLFRMAVAGDGPASARGTGEIYFGGQAYELRKRYPERVAHCQMMYFGRTDMLRQLGGRLCPPEVTTALGLRKLVINTLTHLPAEPPGAGGTAADSNEANLGAGDSGHLSSLPTSGNSHYSGANWRRHPRWPDATAITVPSCYDQLHRRSILDAARLAGLPSIRLIDRGVAIARASIMHREENMLRQPDQPPSQDEHVLYVGLSGQALDVTVLRVHHGQIEQLSAAGQLSAGSLAWSGRLVEIISAQIPDAPGRVRKSPTSRRELVYAARVQMAGERAMNSLLLMPRAQLQLEHAGRTSDVVVTREQWLDACKDLIKVARENIELACQRAKLDPGLIQRCHVTGALLRLPAIRDRVLGDLCPEATVELFERGDAARGAAACVASELPGNRQRGLPVRTIACRSIGFVVAEPDGRRGILPIIPRGTAVPARTNRQLRGKPKNNQVTLSLAESSGTTGEQWQTLGRHTIEVAEGETLPTRRLGFELDINGLLSVHLERPDLGRTIVLPSLPPPTVDESQWADWRQWIENSVS